MKERPDSSYPDEWVTVARRDWHRIHVLLADGDADGAGFFLQQALEKYLKAFLLRRGWKLKKVLQCDFIKEYLTKGRNSSKSTTNIQLIKAIKRLKNDGSDYPPNCRR